jgi:hypothetical protein
LSWPPSSVKEWEAWRISGCGFWKAAEAGNQLTVENQDVVIWMA